MRRLLSVLLLAFVASGCGGDEAPGDPVSFQLFGDPQELAIYRELADAYRAKTGTTVTIVPVADRKDHIAKLATSFAARRPPDVFLLNYRNLGGFAARHAVEPWDRRLARRGGLAREDFFAVTTDAFTIDGQLRCLPQNASSLVVYVNERLFATSGLEVPRRRWSFAEFLAAARRLRRAAPTAVAIEPNAIRAAAFVFGAGGELRGEPDRLTLDTPAARRGLAALLALRSEGLAPSSRNANALSAEERFLRGEAGMFLSSRRDVPSLRTIDDFEWDVAPFPILERPASVLHSDGFCVARGAGEDAMRFAEFAAGPEGQRLLARGGRTVPSLRSVAQSPAFLESSPPASNQVFLDQVAVTRRMPVTRNWTRAEESIDLAVEEAFYGRLTLDEMLRRIAAETDGKL